MSQKTSAYCFFYETDRVGVVDCDVCKGVSEYKIIQYVQLFGWATALQSEAEIMKLYWNVLKSTAFIG